MTDTDTIPPLPARYGDTRVPMAYWKLIELRDDTQCWVWSGDTSPSGNPVHRRTSVWRYVFSSLCPNYVIKAGVRVLARCGNKMCVNPDHRVPPSERPPVFACRECGRPTDTVIYPNGRESVEKQHQVWPDIKQQAEKHAAELEYGEPVVPAPKIPAPPFKVTQKFSMGGSGGDTGYFGPMPTGRWSTHPITRVRLWELEDGEPLKPVELLELKAFTSSMKERLRECTKQKVEWDDHFEKLYNNEEI